MGDANKSNLDERVSKIDDDFGSKETRGVIGVTAIHVGGFVDFRAWSVRRMHPSPIESEILRCGVSGKRGPL